MVVCSVDADTVQVLKISREWSVYMKSRINL